MRLGVQRFEPWLLHRRNQGSFPLCCFGVGRADNLQQKHQVTSPRPQRRKTVNEEWGDLVVTLDKRRPVVRTVSSSFCDVKMRSSLRLRPAGLQ